VLASNNLKYVVDVFETAVVCAPVVGAAVVGAAVVRAAVVGAAGVGAAVVGAAVVGAAVVGAAVAAAEPQPEQPLAAFGTQITNGLAALYQPVFGMLQLHVCKAASPTPFVSDQRLSPT